MASFFGSVATSVGQGMQENVVRKREERLKNEEAAREMQLARQKMAFEKEMLDKRIRADERLARSRSEYDAMAQDESLKAEGNWRSADRRSAEDIAADNRASELAREEARIAGSAAETHSRNIKDLYTTYMEHGRNSRSSGSGESKTYPPLEASGWEYAEVEVKRPDKEEWELGAYMTVNQISHKDFPTRKWVQGGELVTASGINTGSDMYLPGMGDTKGFDRAAALANERDINLEDPQVRNKYGQNLLKIMKDAPTHDDMIEEFNNFETQMGYIPKAALDYLASKERKQKLSRADTARTAREASPGAAGSSQIPLPEGFMPYYQSYLEQTGYEPPQRKGGALTDAAAKQPPPPQATAPQAAAAAAPQAAAPQAAAPQAAATGGDISYGEKQASFLSTAEARFGLPPEITKLIITGQQSKLDPEFPKLLIGEVLTAWGTFNRTGQLSQDRIPYYQNSGTR